MPPGSLLQVQLHQLRPTQPAIGHDQVLYKLGKYACDRRKLFDDYCEANGQHLSGGSQPATPSGYGRRVAVRMK